MQIQSCRGVMRAKVDAGEGGGGQGLQGVQGGQGLQGVECNVIKIS